MANSINDTMESILAEMLKADSVHNSMNIGQRRIENVAWYDFAFYEFFCPSQKLDNSSTVPISSSAIRLLDDLGDTNIEISDLLEFLNQVSKSILLGSSKSLSSHSESNLYLPLLQDPEIRSKLIDAYLGTLIESGKLSSLYYAYSAVDPHLRPKLLSSFNFDTDNLKQTLLSLNGHYESFPKHDVLSEWSNNIDSLTQNRYFHILVNGSEGKNLRVLDNPSVIFRLENPPLPEQSEWPPVGPLPGEVKDYPIDSPGGGSTSSDDEPPKSIPSYAFDPFAGYTWNIGLRYLYRQEWRPLGIQRGETVKTIPLGPKQIEKFSTKILKRTKVTTTSESLKSVETTTETSDTTKDSTEIVNESSKSFGWHVDAEASASWGWGSAKVSGGSKGDSEKKTKSASNQLSETMQKTASKIRTESKIVVSTESESTFEETTSSEIQNPNDEIALTYVYSKLQRQYEIFTSLNQLDGVLFVAEPMAMPAEIDEEWVRNYDWIISEALLDNSFRDALTSISQEIEPTMLGSTSTEMTRINNAMESANKFLFNFPPNISNVSLASADMSQEAQKGYRETLKEELEKDRNKRLAEKKRQRFLQHVRDNILHYYRAIWSKEDSEQRLLRYEKQKIMIPTVWKLVLDTTVITDFDPDTIDDGVLLNGHFEPDLSDPNTMMQISDLIQPAQPIGFVGNYAVFKIKQIPKIDNKYENDLFDMLILAKSAYIDPNSPETLVDPQLKAIQEKEVVPQIIPTKVKQEMIDIVPELRSEYEPLSQEEKTIFIENDDNFTNELYWQYLFRKQNIRRFVVDTNNLLVDIEVGNGSALEPFKKLHRYIDVLKASEDRIKSEMENKRREKLLDKEQLGDPDVEKVTVVTGNKKALDLTTLDINDGEA